MEKAVLLKKIRRHFKPQYEIWEKYYKKYQQTGSFLLEIANPKGLKQAKGELRKYQLELLDFSFEWFDKFEELGLEYFFIGGNLLGAYRANALIPWDDDIDVGMMRADYEKLYEHFKSNLFEIKTDEIFYSKKNKWVIIKKYLEKHPNIPAIVRYPTNLQIIKGTSVSDLMFIDIHPYDYYCDDFSIENMREYLAEIKKQHLVLDNYDKVNNFLQKERLNNPNIVKKSNTIYCGIDHWDAIWFPCEKYFRENDIYPIQKIDFEGRKVSAPNNIIKFLELTYGNSYNEMPRSIKVLEHKKYRENIIKQSKIDTLQKKKKEYSKEKALIIKKIKNKFFKDKAKKYKNLYKKIKPQTDALFDFVDVQKINPTKQKDLRQMQLKITDFAKEISDFLEQNELKYFLNGGSLIGAIRHQGFVPWDDDFDFGLMRKDYEKLKEILPKYFKMIDISKISYKKANKNRIVHEALKNSKGEILCFIGPKYIQIFKGETLANCVLVDVFPHDYYREDYTIKEHVNYLNYIKNKLIKANDFNKMNEFLKKEIKNSSNIVEKSNKIHYAIDNFGSYTTNHYKFMTYDMIFPLKKMKFENYEFNVPNDSHEYIKVQYPNYMEIPRNFAVAPDLKIRQKFNS